tara:strand:+ start:554 stop:781 length:228 start_codon:yes stop_codon:yes gene_type:complete
MSEKYFKKSKDKFKVGYSSKVFKYDFRKHNLEDLQERFVECDSKGKEIKKTTKKVETKKTETKKVEKEVDNGDKD